MYTANKNDNLNNLKNAGQNFVENAKDEVREGARDLRETAYQAGRKVKNLVNTASDEFTHATEATTSHIRSNPVQSSFIALGVGFLIGSLFGRK